MGSALVNRLAAQSTLPADLLCAQTLVNGDVALTWGASAEGCGAFVQYDVYAANAFAGPYVLLASLPGIGTTTYTHVGANGTITTWYYYVVAVYACAGYTMTPSDTLDNLDPIAPELDYVTVTAGQSVINWIPSVSSETNSYIIYRDNGGFTPIATVYGRFTTSYTDVTGSPTTQVETYTIAARDSCDNLGPFNNASHHTILLSVQQLNCSDVLNLSWNLYDTWPAGVSAYEVWVDKNFTGAVMTASLPAVATSYDLTGLIDGDHVCITVRAVRADGTAVSVSNEYCNTLNIVTAAQYNVIRTGTVKNPTQILIEWYPDAAADLEKYSVRRSTNNVDFVNIITGNIGFPILPLENFYDNTVSPPSQSYYYKVVTIDSCDNEFESGTVRTILLKGFDNANFTNTLNWNAFEMTNATITGYNIHRDNGTGFNLVATVPAGTITYTDDVSAYINVVSDFCYEIECTYQLIAPENGVNEALTSYSNDICVEQGPRIYVPNAIVPGGTNTIFKPVIIYGQSEGYSMKIFNRYGQNIFESDDIDTGWDGTYNGQIVELGTYAYLISFTATNGQIITKKGNVTVVR